MVKRRSARGEFWGCSKFPRCRGIVNIADTEIHGDMMRRGWGGVEKLEEPVLLTGSPQQDRIWNVMLKGAGDIVVDAKAGTGKTTTLVQGVLRLPRNLRIIVLAFNVHVGKELTRQFERYGITNATASTYNSFGWRMFREAFPQSQVVEDKLDSIMQQIIPEAEYVFLSGSVEKMVRLLKCHLYYDATISQMEELNDRFNLDCTAEQTAAVYRYAPQILRACEQQLGGVDYDDQIYLTVKLGLPIKQYDIVMVDEAQDTSLFQQALALSACRDGRMIVVGDKYQAIYGFRGADVDAIPRMTEALKGRKNGAEVMPLSVSRRCAKSHIRLAQIVVPEIEAMPDAPEGIILEVDKPTALDMMTPGDLVLCRVNAPLISTCYTLSRRGVKAIVRGRDIGKGMENLIRKLRPVDIHDLMGKVREFHEREQAKLLKLGKKGGSRIQALQDRVDCLLSLCEGTNDLMGLHAKIKQIFSDFDESGRPKDAVVFGTVHRTKGLEAPSVFVLQPELMPHPMAEAPWEKQQELHLAYVAATRAKYDNATGWEGRLVFIGALPPALGGKPVEPARRKPRGRTETMQEQLDMQNGEDEVRRIEGEQR